jgi:carboxymethylenebutenolidase
VQRIDANVKTPEGDCSTILVTPDGDGPFAPVILFTDAGGVRPSMVEMAEQLAAIGYAAFLPEMFYRDAPYEPFDLATVFSDREQRSRLMAMMGKVTVQAARSDIGAFIDHLDTVPSVDASRIGATGYCMGGRLSLTAASSYPDRIAAAASFHGGYLVTDAPDSPHLAVGAISGRIYVAAAEQDGSFTEDQAAVLESALTDAGVDHTVEFYPALHGFAVPDNLTYDAAAAARHWTALESLFAATLSR